MLRPEVQETHGCHAQHMRGSKIAARAACWLWRLMLRCRASCEVGTAFLVVKVGHVLQDSKTWLCQRSLLILFTTLFGLEYIQCSVLSIAIPIVTFSVGQMCHLLPLDMRCPWRDIWQVTSCKRSYADCFLRVLLL